MREFGIDIQASLKLVSTTLDLSHPMTQSASSQNGNGGSQSGAGSGSGPGTSAGGDSGSRTGGTTTGTGQPTSNQGQPKSPLGSANWLPWVYGLLGIAAVAIVGSGVWIARRRIKKTSTKTSTVQLSI
jgi:cobalamin biosynthesis Mg chelatase CobN